MSGDRVASLLRFGTQHKIRGGTGAGTPFEYGHTEYIKGNTLFCRPGHPLWLLRGRV